MIDMTFTQEHKDKISSALKKYYSNPENREARSKILKAFYESHQHHRVGSHLTLEHKDIISKHNTGRKLTKEQIDKRITTLRTKRKRRRSKRQSEGLKKYYEEHEVWNKGVVHSQETKECMSKAMKEYWKQRKRRVEWWERDNG